MNWKVEKGTEADAGKIAEFQIDMALESEGAILDRDKILNGVRAGLSDPAKGTYYIVRTESGETAGSLLVTKEWSDWNNCWYWWIQSVFVKPEYRRQGAFSYLSTKRCAGMLLRKVLPVSGSMWIVAIGKLRNATRSREWTSAIT